MAGCESTLSLFPQSEDEDRKLMEDGRMFTKLSRRQRMAVKLRRNEKRILLRTMRVCEGALDAIADEVQGVLA